MRVPSGAPIRAFLASARLKRNSRARLSRETITSVRRILSSKEALTVFYFSQSFPYLVHRPLMLNVTIEAENSRLKVCYSSEIGKKSQVLAQVYFVIMPLSIDSEN